MLRTLNLMVALAIVGWTAVSAGSFVYHIRDNKRHIEHVARETARESIEKDMLYRYWASEYGGVYVPVTKKTPPNPYLSFLKERDITTPSGRRLTLVNPAYMSRQVHELSLELSNIQGHITSLTPVRPGNAPDPWEKKALRIVQSGRKPFGEVVSFKGEPYYRLMSPLYTQKPCLACHGAQGYKLGDLRGGMSASIPMALFNSISAEHFSSEVKHFGGTWALGIVCIALAAPFVRRRIREREDAVAAVEASEGRLRSIVDNAPFGAHLYRLEPDGRLLFTGSNAAADRILGIDHRQFIGRTVDDMFPSLAGTDIPGIYRRVAVSGTAAVLDNITYEDGRLRGVFEVHAVQSAPGQVTVFFRDITERSRAEQALKESEERYSTIVHTAQEGIMSIDARQNITFVNTRMAVMLGYAAEEMIGMPVTRILHPEELEDHGRQMDLRRKGMASQFERQYRRKDGGTVRTLVAATPLLDEGDGFIGAFDMVTDITERAEMQALLTASERQLRTIFDTMQAGLILVDPLGTIVFANRHMAEMFKCPLEELIGSSYPAHIHPEERTTGDRRMQQLIAGEIASVSLERHYIASDGSDFWGYLSGRRIEDENGALISLIGIITDITERKRAETALMTSEAYLRLAVDCGAVGLWEWDVESGRLNWNDRLKAIFGLPQETADLTLERFIAAIHRDDVGEAERRFRNALKERSEFRHEYRILQPEGVVRWILAVGRGVYDEQGLPVRMLGGALDITERKQAEMELQASEEKYRQLFTNNPVPMWVYDEETLRFLAVNEFAIDHYGYSRDEFNTMTLRDIRAPEEIPHLYRTLQHTSGQNVRKDILAKHRKKDGTVIDVHVTGHEMIFEGHRAVLIHALDITERRRAETALRESEERLKEAQRIGRIGNWEWIASDNRLWWSEEVYTIFGMPAGKDVSVARYLERIHPQDRERVHRSMEEAIARADKDWQIAYRIMLPSGEVRHLFESAKAELCAFGTVCRRHGIIQDITERKLAEDALRRSESLARSIIEAEPECVKILGPGGILRFMNPAGLAMIEVESLDAVLGQSVYALVLPEHRDAFVALTERVFRGESGMLEFEMVGTGGTRRWLETHAVPLLDGFGNVEALLGITRDVTARKRAEHGLKESRAQLDIAMGAAKMGVWQYDVKTDRRTFDRQACRLLGIDHDSCNGTEDEFFQAIHPDDRDAVLAAFKRTLDHNESLEPEFRIRRADGSVQHISARGMLVRDAAGRPDRITGILWDITDRKHAEEQQRKLEEQLLQSQKIESVGRLAGGIAHDINNMLTPILGYADMLGLRLPAEDPGRGDLEEIISAANRVKDMTQQLLAFARKQTLIMRPLDVNVVISRFSKMLRRTLPENILIDLKLSPSIGAILADERQLEQVILNLAVNAQDAMPSGGALTIASKDIDLDRGFTGTRPGLFPGRHVLVEIADTGVGMDGEALTRLFDPFFTTKASGRGTGLGLATVYGIIKQHKGYIDVTSDLRQGTTFSLYFPVTEGEVEDAGRVEEEVPRRGTETVLVVEDQNDVRGIVRQLLAELGYRVLTAGDGAEAVEALRVPGAEVDLLITDVIMPDSNGKELYDRLKRSHPSLRVLYMSGYPADVISTHGVLDKGVHFLRKPFSAQELSRKVRESIDAVPP